MSKIAFYTDSREVFDIAEFGGISYFILDKSIHSKKFITSICKNSSIIGCNYEEHCGNDVCTYPNAFISIINKCKGNGLGKSLLIKRFVYTAEQERGYENKIDNSDIDVMQGEKCVGYMPASELYTRQYLEKYKIITPIIISGNTSIDKNGYFCRYFNAYYIGPNQVPKGSFPILRYFDTEMEAKSFCSYVHTKFFIFLLSIGVCGTTLTSEFFRFVPDPGSFDHIFTDVELYKKYNLTNDEINIIESVIKERK